MKSFKNNKKIERINGNIDVKDNAEIKYSVDGLNHGEQKKEHIGMKGSPKFRELSELQRGQTQTLEN